MKPYGSISVEDRFWSHVEKSNGCWIWRASLYSNGYGDTKLSPFGRRSGLAHRVSWEFTYGEIPEGLNVCHSCDNPSCVRPDHLFVATQKENVRDMMVKGRMVIADHRGEKNTKSKLKTEDVIYLRSLGSGRLPYGSIKQLSRKLGVTKETLRNARKSLTWSHI